MDHPITSHMPSSSSFLTGKSSLNGHETPQQNSPTHPASVAPPSQHISLPHHLNFPNMFPPMEIFDPHDFDQFSDLSHHPTGTGGTVAPPPPATTTQQQQQQQQQQQGGNLQHSPFNTFSSTLSRNPSLGSMTNFTLPNSNNPLSRVGSFHNSLNFAYSSPNAPYSLGGFSHGAQTQTQNNAFHSLLAGDWMKPPPPIQQQTPDVSLYPMFQHIHHQQQQQQHSPPPPLPVTSVISKQPRKSKKVKLQQPPQHDMAKTVVGHEMPFIIPPPPMMLHPSVQQQQQHGLHLEGEDSVTSKTRSRLPSSVYRGVSKCSKDGRWQARIRVKRQVTYLGRFVKEEDAAKKYDEAAREHHGDKAVLNFLLPEDVNVGRKQAMGLLSSETDQDLPPI